MISGGTRPLIRKLLNKNILRACVFVSVIYILYLTFRNLLALARPTCISVSLSNRERNKILSELFAQFNIFLMNVHTHGGSHINAFILLGIAPHCSTTTTTFISASPMSQSSIIPATQIITSIALLLSLIRCGSKSAHFNLQPLLGKPQGRQISNAPSNLIESDATQIAIFTNTHAFTGAYVLVLIGGHANTALDPPPPLTLCL